MVYSVEMSSAIFYNTVINNDNFYERETRKSHLKQDSLEETVF